MSAPVIFSSPSAPQEPFKGPNTDENTHACTKYACIKQTHIHKIMNLIANHKQNVFLTLIRQKSYKLKNKQTNKQVHILSMFWANIDP